MMSMKTITIIPQILQHSVSIYKLENEDLDEMQIIDYFRKIKSNLQTREDISHPTILKENENEKIFDFYNNNTFLQSIVQMFKNLI